MQNLYYIFVILIIILCSCANPQPPSGGPPDTSKPEIIYSVPPDGKTNFQDNAVILEFNKYMNKNKVRENLFIQPAIGYDISWSGKQLEIEFREKLDSNTTYALILGTDYTDIYNNSPAESFSLVFSTGAIIDSGKITGKLYGDNIEGTYIFVYRIYDDTIDTLNPAVSLAKVKTQVGSSGTFDIKALRDGKYRIFAVGDKFKNGLIDQGVDRFGSSSEDVIISGDSIPRVKIKLGQPIDKTGPLLYSAKQSTNRIIQVSFSENLDTASISSTSFLISDTNHSITVKAIAANISIENPRKVDLVTEQSLFPGKWILSANNDTSLFVRDSSGNKLQDTSSSCSFSTIDLRDTIKPYIAVQPIKDSATNISREPQFSIVFNIGINSKNISDRIKLYNLSDSSTLKCRFKWKADNHLIIAPELKLENLKWYRLEFTMDSIFSMNGLKSDDSVYKYNFQTEDTRNYGAISGSLIKSKLYNSSYYVVIKPINGKTEHYVEVDNSGRWRSGELPPGDYTLEVFADLNENGKYDYGDFYPYKRSEPFVIIEKVFTIKPRWEFENVSIKFDIE